MVAEARRPGVKRRPAGRGPESGNQGDMACFAQSDSAFYWISRHGPLPYSVFTLKQERRRFSRRWRHIVHGTTVKCDRHLKFFQRENFLVMRGSRVGFRGGAATNRAYPHRWGSRGLYYSARRGSGRCGGMTLGLAKWFGWDNNRCQQENPPRRGPRIKETRARLAFRPFL